MKRYESLVIIKHTVRDDGLKETIDRITAEIAGAGAKVETVQKMDRRNFARVADKKHPAGYYVNFIFEASPNALAALRHRLAMNEDVFRVNLTLAPPPVPEAAAA